MDNPANDMNEKSKHKFYVNEDNVATIVCPDCNNIRIVNVSKIISNKSQINVRCKCKCGNVFNAVIERRRFYRKSIRFTGNCYLTKGLDKTPIIVTDISRSGIKFEHSNLRTFIIGEEILVEFYLDDVEKSLINKVIIIRSSAGNKVGAEFKSSEHYDKLGSYLLFKS